MTWALVVVGGGALLTAGAGYAGSKKQSDASKAAGNLNMDMFRTLNQQQQPFIQSGYGAMSKLNTLLGLSPNPNAANAARFAAPSGSSGPPGMAYNPNGSMDPRMQVGNAPQQPPQWNVPEAGMGNLQLRRILSLRAQNGDRQAQAMLSRVA